MENGEERISGKIEERFSQIDKLKGEIWNLCKDLAKQLNEKYKEKIVDSHQEIVDAEFFRWRDEYENPLWMEVKLIIVSEKQKDDFDDYKDWLDYKAKILDEDTDFISLIEDIEESEDLEPLSILVGEGVNE